MRIALVTDAWRPQVNGVVTALAELVEGVSARGHEVHVIEPGAFKRFPCPGYREIELAWRPGRGVARQLDALQPDAVHIATEGPMGAAARRHCLRRGWAFTTAFHTRFPEILAKGLRIPVRWSYAWFRRFHAPAAAVMVPSDGMLELLRGHGFANARAWSHGVDLRLFHPTAALTPGEPPEPWRRPVFLYVGRLSYEKNLEAFLSLDLPGTKVVYGTGPLRDQLMAAFPDVQWRGLVPRHALPAIYGGADVFVFPGRSETFGLVMLEAMACGTPVAAYPVPGPLDVVGDSAGGVLHEDLKTAALQALALSRQGARERALRFDWSTVCEQFLLMLVPARPGEAPGATAGSQAAPHCP